MESVAKLAAAEREYRAAKDHMDRPLSQNPTSDTSAAAGDVPPSAPAAAPARGKVSTCCCLASTDTRFCQVHKQ